MHPTDLNDVPGIERNIPLTMFTNIITLIEEREYKLEPIFVIQMEISAESLLFAGSGTHEVAKQSSLRHEKVENVNKCGSGKKIKDE